MPKPKILAFAGSTRNGSVNQQLLDHAAKIATGAGADVTVVKLADYRLPIYDQDLEQREGLPENAKRLKQLFDDHDAMLLACPEYNSSITPLLKNTIDWVSRPADENDSPLSAYEGKTAAIISASPGGLGGLRGLRHVREILSNIKVLVVPAQVALSNASNAFDDDGALKDSRQAAMLSACVEQLVEVAASRLEYSAKR